MYYEEIDTIGESDLNNTNEVVIEESDLIIDVEESINNVKENIEELRSILDGFKTYSENVFMIKQLNTLILKEEQTLSNLKATFDAYVEFHEPKI